MKTIFAQSTGRGKAGVAVIRISGPDSLNILRKLTRRAEFNPNKLYLEYLLNNASVIDRAMVVYFKAPHSFTGEDVVELHVHGSIAIIRMITNILLELGLSLAEPGEFSKRAFLNGKMDLTAAEGLADLIDSETEMQHRQAMRHMSGEFEDLCNKWRQQLLKSLSLMEAYIDFPDEEIPNSVLSSTQDIIDELRFSLDNKLRDNRRGERLRSGITMAVLGEPNVGKSSLVNFLVQRDVSIVSEIAGTTRDVIETHLDIAGYPIILVDTAGLRGNSEDVIEKEGMKRAHAAALYADIKIVVIEASKSKNVPKAVQDLIDDNAIVVMNKIDKLEQSCDLASINPIYISIKQKINLDGLIASIIRKSEELVGSNDDVVITRERHRIHITKALDALMSCDIRGDLVLAVEDLRIAARNLSLMTGKIEIEEILGEIFQNFCIGK